MIIMSMTLSPLGRSAAPLKIGGSLMYLHATGTIPDLDKLEPYWPRRRAPGPDFTPRAS
jgi:hypothetical protein